MKSFFPYLLAAALAASLLGVVRRGSVSEPAAVSVFDKSAPESTADLRAIEQAAREIAAKVVPCTVGLQVGPAQGSGVIISADGYVLTAAHVTGQPGREVNVRLPDGTVLRGKTLGMHTVVDAGLVKITDEGPWPFAPIVPRDEGPQAGQWCLATGHPSGFQTQRSAPVRVGRVIDVRDDVLRSDCPITGGDSGGPLFDMQGRVIGIHSRIADDLTINLHAPAVACLDVWEQLNAGEIYPEVPASRFFDRLDIDRDGKLSRAELPEGVYRDVFDRLANKYALDPEKAHALEDLTELLGWRPTPFRDFGRAYTAEDRFSDSLLAPLYLRGSTVREAFGEAVAGTTGSIVAVECNGEAVALGTIVGADGWIVTKASELTGDIRCRLPDGRRFAAELAGTEKEYDLALLRIDAQQLAAVTWKENEDLQPASWVVTPGFEGIESVGVMSVGERKIVGIPGVLGVEIATDRPEVRIARVFPNSGAAEAGISEGDIINRIMDQPVAVFDELRAALQQYRSGDVVRVQVVRDNKELQFEVTLGAPEDIFFRFGRSRLNGPLSRRRDGFPRAIQHDSVLAPSQCGGPLVDLAGHTVGINIARADRIATYAIPAAAVAEIVRELQSAAEQQDSDEDTEASPDQGA